MAVDITKLIELNKKHIEAKREFDRIKAEILAQGDGVLEGETCNLIVKDGKIEIVPKPGLPNSDE